MAGASARLFVRTHTDLAQRFALRFHVNKANRVTFIVQMKFVLRCSAPGPMPLTIMDAQRGGGGTIRCGAV